ncbi:MAG: GntR family transcriptional regulator [Spirochaetes bacterium]|nr:GntR family transcriptional regulator [Spirochaetota bacterium]
MQRKVDQDSYQPSYLQLVDIIQEQISSGKLRPGDRLPTESQLCAFHNLSPMTVHKAISLLIKSGTIVTKRGKGIFVKPMQFWDASFKLGKLQYLLSEKADTEVKLVTLQITRADSIVCSKLKIKTNENVLFMHRLILAEGKAFLSHFEYLLYDPKSPIIESAMEAISLKDLFEWKGNQHFKKNVLSIRAVNLKDEEALLLNAPANTAAFCIEHLFFDYNDKPVSWGWFVCPGDRMHFSNVISMGNGELKNENK